MKILTNVNEILHIFTRKSLTTANDFFIFKLRIETTR